MAVNATIGAFLPRCTSTSDHQARRTHVLWAFPQVPSDRRHNRVIKRELCWLSMAAPWLFGGSWASPSRPSRQARAENSWALAVATACPHNPEMRANPEMRGCEVAHSRMGCCKLRAMARASPLGYTTVSTVVPAYRNRPGGRRGQVAKTPPACGKVSAAGLPLAAKAVHADPRWNEEIP